MKVGAGDAAGGADFAEERAGVDEVAGLNGGRLEMAIEGVEAEAVIEDDGVAGKIEWLGEDYAAALRGVYRSAGRSREVDAAVGRPGLAVEDAALAEIAAGGDSGKRITEIAVP